VRFANIIALLSEYASSPSRWLGGLGFYSYSAIDPEQGYSHCLSADMLAELGIVGFILYLGILGRAVKDIFASFASVSNSPELRNALGCLVGLLIYQFLLANKQGNVLGSCMLFTTALILARVRRATMEMSPAGDQRLDS
jgi:O-antigen ligase